MPLWLNATQVFRIGARRVARGGQGERGPLAHLKIFQLGKYFKLRIGESLVSTRVKLYAIFQVFFSVFRVARDIIFGWTCSVCLSGQ